MPSIPQEDDSPWKEASGDQQPSEAYWRAYEEWKRLPEDLGGSIDASKRFTGGEAHERR